MTAWALCLDALAEATSTVLGWLAGRWTHCLIAPGAFGAGVLFTPLLEVLLH